MKLLGGSRIGFKLPSDFATRHSLVQQVDLPTHGVEILDLIFTNNPDLVSSVMVESWPAFTDHKLVTASTSFILGTEPEKEEIHLLECGKRLKKLNFNKAEWVEVQAELAECDWSDLETAAKTSPTLALSWKNLYLYWRDMFHLSSLKRKKAEIELIEEESYAGEGYPK